MGQIVRILVGLIFMSIGVSVSVANSMVMKLLHLVRVLIVLINQVKKKQKQLPGYLKI